jgi:S-adenosylmethionine:tRNA ribosyltransferase-isomerase
MRLADFDYDLPPGRIAQTPVEPRDSARLLCVPNGGDQFTHRIFRDLPDLLHPGDLLVLNETRVSAIRLAGVRPSGAPLEALLLGPSLPHGLGAFDALVRPARSLRPGTKIHFPEGNLEAEVVAPSPGGGRILRFHGTEEAIETALHAIGRVPLPPYITAPLGDANRYQTVYARIPGSAAAPTAGLHFTDDLFERLARRGVATTRLRLDVGLGTFRPIRETEDVRKHEMHSERFEVSEETADAVNACPGRVIAVGTTALRALESAAMSASVGQRVGACGGETNIFLYPGHDFRGVDGLITNFHQPGSTLLLLVAALAGTSTMRSAYQTALDSDYRFLSFGDAMLII